MRPELVEILICPVCGGSLRENQGALICSAGHTANIARQGYVSLLGPHAGTHTADSAEMVAARERFLGAGHFHPLSEALGEEVGRALAVGGEPGERDSPEGVVLDLGTGTGHHLAAVLESVGAQRDMVGLGIDNSKYAARRAARCHPRAGAIVADIWDGIPVRTGAATIVINVFSPRHGEEINRILVPGGTLVTVTPTDDHLKELIEPFEMISVDPEKKTRLENSLGPLGGRLESRVLDWTMELDRDGIRDLVGMGPSAGRLGPDALEAELERLGDSTPVSGSVRIGSATA